MCTGIVTRFSNILICLILISHPAASSGPATPVTSASPGDITFDFSDVDIRSFIKIVSELTGENYVIDPSVNGKISVTSPRPVARSAVPALFTSILEVYGYSAVPDGDIIKILPSARARQEGTAVITGGRPAEGHFVETHIISLKNTAASGIKDLIQSLLTRAGTLAVHSPSNTIILTDTHRNAERLSRVIETLDGAGPRWKIHIRHLAYADSKAVADALRTLYRNRSGPPGNQPVFVPEPHGNVLLVRAPDEVFPEIWRILDELDMPRPKERSVLHVYPLRYADAAELASVLNAQMSGGDGDSTSGSAQKKTARRLSIAADRSSNALIVSAPPEDAATIESVIRQLDVPRRQVLVEALIVEISSDRTRELGIEWRITNDIEGDAYTGMGGTNLPTTGGEGALAGLAENPRALPPGMTLGLVKGTVRFNGVDFANIAALARAMEGTSGVNVLSKPHLVAVDNQEAEIIVGEERPFLTKSQTTDNGTVVRSYEFKDIGLSMRITPRITDNGHVLLKLEETIKNFVAEAEVGAVTSTKREAKTTVRVADGEMAVIGGLLKEDDTGRSSRVPCLGTLPWIGYLFRADRSQHTKTNLLIFITPHILKDAADMRRAAELYRSRIPAPEDAPGDAPEENELLRLQTGDTP